MVHAGAISELGHDGALRLRCGLVRPEDHAAAVEEPVAAPAEEEIVVTAVRTMLHGPTIRRQASRRKH